MNAILTILLGRLPVGWMQLHHNRTRLIAAVGGVTFANVLIFMQLGFMSALFRTSVFTHRALDADIVLVSSNFRSLREASPVPRARMFQALCLPEVIDATPVYLGTIFWTDPQTGDTTNFRIIGVDPDKRTFADDALHRQIHALRIADTALVDRKTRQFNSEIEAKIRDTGRVTIEVTGHRLDLTGLFAQGASFDVDGSIVVSDQTFLRLFPRRKPGAPTIALLQVDANKPDAAEDIAKAINRRFPETDCRALTKQQFIDAEQSYQATQTPIGFVFGFGVVIGLVVGVVIVYQVLSTDVQDHLSEYATFKAIGYPPRFFLGVVFEEAVGLAALGFLPGLFISLALYRLAAAKTDLPIEMPFTRPLLVFVLTAAMCTISGAIATRRLNSADPAELF